VRGDSFGGGVNVLSNVSTPSTKMCSSTLLTTNALWRVSLARNCPSIALVSGFAFET
jgi:hypothetical protein